MSFTIPKGETITIGRVVDYASTAAAIAAAGETFPEVFATPVMISEMERACAAILQSRLQPGELSVGVKVEITHFAATPVGLRVDTHARFISEENSLYWFEVWSEDVAGMVGKGRHARAVVQVATILAKADARRQGAG